MKTLPAPTPDADEVEFNSLGAEAQLIAYMKSVRQWDLVTAPNNLRHEDRPLYILVFLGWDEEPQQWPTSVDLQVAALLLMPIPLQTLGRTAEQDAPYHAHQKLIMKLLSELLPEAFRDQPIPIAEIVRIATRKESQQWLSPQSPFHLLGLERLWGQKGRKNRMTKECLKVLPVYYKVLTQPERRAVREEYVRQQGGKCAHCGCDLTGAARDDILAKRVNARLFPPNFFRWPVHLHHCHKTGMTIGAVHSHCNAVLWQYHGE